jgi:hypothetical protein
MILILLRILRYLFYFYFILKLLLKSIFQLVVYILRKLKPIFYILLVIRQILLFSVLQFHFVFIIYMALVPAYQIKFKFLSFSEGNIEIYIILFFLVFSFFHEWLREEQKSIFINILSSMLVITSLKSLLFLGTFDNLFFQFFCVS